MDSTTAVAITVTTNNGSTHLLPSAHIETADIVVIAVYFALILLVGIWVRIHKVHLKGVRGRTITT